MEREVSGGTNLGIVLIALAAIIGLGFGVFAIAKGVANDGVTQVQENLNTVGDSVFGDFDQKIVTGTQLNSAYQNFQGKNVAILVATQSSKNFAAGAVADTGGKITGTGLSNGPGVAEAYAGKGSKVPGVAAYADAKCEQPYAISGIVNGAERTILVNRSAFVNYNALLNGTVTTEKSGDEYVCDAAATGGKIYFDNSCFRTATGFATKSGKVMFNNTSANMTKSGMMEYVPSGARFQANLLKDESGTIMGVVFEQINAGR